MDKEKTLRPSLPSEEKMRQIDKGSLDILKLATDLADRKELQDKEQRKFSHETTRIIVVALMTACIIPFRQL